VRETVEILQPWRECLVDDDHAGNVGGAGRLDGSPFRLRKRRADDADRFEDVLRHVVTVSGEVLVRHSKRGILKLLRDDVMRLGRLALNRAR
jgi:hypothetical protein